MKIPLSNVISFWIDLCFAIVGLLKKNSIESCCWSFKNFCWSDLRAWNFCLFCASQCRSALFWLVCCTMCTHSLTTWFPSHKTCTHANKQKAPPPLPLYFLKTWHSFTDWSPQVSGMYRRVIPNNTIIEECTDKYIASCCKLSHILYIPEVNRHPDRVSTMEGNGGLFNKSKYESRMTYARIFKHPIKKIMEFNFNTEGCRQSQKQCRGN